MTLAALNRNPAWIPSGSFTALLTKTSHEPL